MAAAPIYDGMNIVCPPVQNTSMVVEAWRAHWVAPGRAKCRRHRATTRSNARSMKGAISGRLRYSGSGMGELVPIDVR